MKIKIAALGFRGFPNVQGGIERHCENVYPRLVKLGCEVIAFCRSPYTQKKPFMFKGVRMIPVWMPKNKLIEAIFHTGICTILATKYKPDIIHFHAIGPSIFVVLAKMLGLKVVSTHHGFDYEREKWGRFAKLILKVGEKQLCKSDHCIAVSDHIRERLVNQFPCKVTTIPNGVMCTEILPFGEFCTKWNLQKDKYFIFVGRLVPEKCIEDLLNAFKMMDSDWKLVIAGQADHEGSYSTKLEEQIVSIKNVVRTGFVHGRELQELYSNAGCFVLPSSHEGLPIVLLEALSFGLPIIVSDIAPNRNIEQQFARFYPVHDINALTQLMQKQCIGQHETDKNIAREYVSANYNWEHIAVQIHNIFRSLITV